MPYTVGNEKLRGAGGFSSERINHTAYSGIKLNYLFVDGAGAGGVFIYQRVRVFKVFFYITIEGLVGEVYLRVDLRHHEIPPAGLGKTVGVADGNRVVGYFKTEGTSLRIEGLVCALRQVDAEVATRPGTEFWFAVAGGEKKEDREEDGRW